MRGANLVSLWTWTEWTSACCESRKLFINQMGLLYRELVRIHGCVSMKQGEHATHARSIVLNLYSEWRMSFSLIISSWSENEKFRVYFIMFTVKVFLCSVLLKNKLFFLSWGFSKNALLLCIYYSVYCSAHRFVNYHPNACCFLFIEDYIFM